MALPSRFAPALEAARGLAWPARRRAPLPIPGAHVARVHRPAAELVEFRSYRQGDEPGSIDWKLLARTDRVYVRLAPERAFLPTAIVLDGSRSMAFPVDTQAKWHLACALAVGLAAIALADGDPVGLLLVGGGRTRWIAPRSRRSVLEEMMAAVDAPADGGAPLAPALAPVLRGLARVAIITDFLGDAEPLRALLGPFTVAGGTVQAVHVVAREELEPPLTARLYADPEQDALRRPFPPTARTAYQGRFADWRRELARAWRGAGAGFTDVVTGGEPLRQALRRVTTPPGAPVGPR